MRAACNRVNDQPSDFGGVKRRDALRLVAALMADWCLPRRLFAQRPQQPSPIARSSSSPSAAACATRTRSRRPAGSNIPHLAKELVPQGLVYPVARYEGLTGHFNSTGALVTGCRQEVDAYGSEAPVTPTVFELFRKHYNLPPEEAWVIATNKSFGLMGGSKLRDYGDPWSANVILPKQLLIETIRSAVSTDAGPGVEDRQALADRMMAALDEGYEGFGWRVFEAGRALGPELKASLAKSLLDYFNDPTVPTSGDELTYFMTREIMNRLAPSLIVVNFWDIDIAHYGAYSLYLEAIRRTDRLVHELWQHAQSLPQYRDKTTLLVAPELGRDGDRGGQRVRQSSQRRRLVPAGLAGGAGRRRAEGRGHRAADSDHRRRADRREDPRLQDAGVRGPGARRAGLLSHDGTDERFSRATDALTTQTRQSLSMRLDARLTGEAATLARTHRDVLERLPATFHASILVELEKWATLFPAEQAYQRALIEHLAQMPGGGRRPRSSRRSCRSSVTPVATG